MSDAQQQLDNIRSECECPICSSLLRDPVATKCGHYFCRECITEWVRGHENCGVCKQHTELSDLTSVMNEAQHRIFRQILNDHPASCENPGCTWTGKYELWLKHEKECEHKLIHCKHCNEEFTRGSHHYAKYKNGQLVSMCRFDCGGVTAFAKLKQNDSKIKELETDIDALKSKLQKRRDEVHRLKADLESAREAKTRNAWDIRSAHADELAFIKQQCENEIQNQRNGFQATYDFEISRIAKQHAHHLESVHKQYQERIIALESHLLQWQNAESGDVSNILLRAQAEAHLNEVSRKCIPCDNEEKSETGTTGVQQGVGVSPGPDFDVDILTSAVGRWDADLVDGPRKSAQKSKPVHTETETQPSNPVGNKNQE